MARTPVLVVELPGEYFRLLAAAMPEIEQQLASPVTPDLRSLEEGPRGRHFPGAILAAAVLYARQHPTNPSHGDPVMLALALRIGDVLADACESGVYTQRLDHHRDTYMWLEAYRLLEEELEEERRARWRTELEKNIAALARTVAERVDYPRYQSPFLYTSPNHYALWAKTVHLAGRVFRNAAWEELGARVLHRFAAEEQTPDGYWGEHSDAGPTTGYNYLTFAGLALYWEHSHDPTALEALRRGTEFHTAYTYPDGQPVEVINDRNRRWHVSAWGHFGFSHFPEGRRYAGFLTALLSEGPIGTEALGRIAQNALYFHEGPTAPIPQELPRFVHQMRVPAGIRKSGPWVVCLSGLISTQAPGNQFYLDRQGHVSVFHEALGLIITGANSKRQPELATFSERVRGELLHLPNSSRLRMADGEDRLSLAYNTFFADLRVPEPSETTVALRFTLTAHGRVEEAQLTLQLCLKAGEELLTEKERVTLGEQALELTPEAIGRWIQHHGWRIRIPPGARLTWPVYPFNPYANGPETSLAHAVGVLTVPLAIPPRAEGGVQARTQEMQFTIEAME